MKQTVEEVAKEYANDCRNRQRHCEPYCIVDFIAGAQWQSKQSPWISVEDRMPETNRSILIKTDHGAIFNGEYNDDHKTWYWMDGVLIETLDGVPSYTSMCSIQEDWKVTHWMEIPE